MGRFSNSDFLDFELRRILSTAPYDGCDIAEFLEAADLAGRAGSAPERWHVAWQAAGERAEVAAVEAAARGDPLAARRGFLRACNYFRASHYLMPRADLARSLPIAERSARCFTAALPLLPCVIEPLRIPYRGEDSKMYELPGYLYLPHPEDRLPRSAIPVLITTCGADSTQEEHYFMLAAAATRLGYSVVTFEGPGQGLVLRRHGLPFRPDWETVVAAVLDALWGLAALRPELQLDTERVALAGLSMGGYLALRGAADKRIAACVAVDPFYSLWDFVRARLPPVVVRLWTSGWLPDGLLDSLAALARRAPTPTAAAAAAALQDRWEFDMSSWMFGVDRPTDMFRHVMRFTLGPPPVSERDERPGGATDGDEKDDYLHRITCPVLVSGAGQSLYFKDLDETTNKIYRGLVNVREADKVVWAPQEPSLGGCQAKIGAFGLLQAKTFAFLDDKFGIKRPRLEGLESSV